MTFPQYREYTNNCCDWPINTNDSLFFAKKQSLLLRTSTRSPTSKTTHRTPVLSIERSRTIFVISNVIWEVYPLEITLKLSKNLSKKRIFPCSFVKFCNLAWIMRFLTNSAKSCDLRSIMRNRNIAEYQKPCYKVFFTCFASNLNLVLVQTF